MSRFDEPHDETTETATAQVLDVLILRGVGDLTSIRAAEEIVAPAFAGDPETAVVVDLSTVTYLSMEAVVPFVTLALRCAAQGTPLRVMASERAWRKLTSLGLHDMLPLEPSPADC
ncbi:STAS domain-containing protein [Labedaea rhizosphaerae]|uniref:Anti-anti-sigma regulatory factor n=1 Tax=Labedaea rhizosphaerae TaxID=598644 RepID=A0A4R6SG59_LABRH|nr:STAS domain-containing protein [Labedaea rhizosphaerae]TDQ00675.1 anti-anti-sigma regulatory factor [Labedaea rhizosphaerae]